MLEPKDKENIKLPGIVIEFKVINPRKESSLEDTVNEALKQIEEKNYDAELIRRGVIKKISDTMALRLEAKKCL